MRYTSHWTSKALVLAFLFLVACDSAEDRAEEHFQSSLELMDAGEVDRAIVELRNVLALDEFHDEARKLYASTLLERGNLRESVRQYRRLVESDPSDQLSRFALTELALNVQSWEEFERHGAVLVNANADIDGMDIVETVLRYREAVERRDDETISEIIVDATELAARYPDSIPIRKMLVEAHLRLGDQRAALIALDRLIALEPDEPRYYMTKARVLAELNELVALEELLRETVRRFPEETEARLTLLRLYAFEGRNERAEEFLREYAETTGENADVVTLIAFIRSTRGSDAALEEINARLSAEPGTTFLEALQAGISFDAGNRDEAVALMQDIITREGDQVQIDNYKVSLARMLLDNGNEVGARQLVEDVLSTDGSHIEALKMSSLWLIEEDEPEEAIGKLRIALDQEPEDADILTLMSRAHLRMGERELAQDLLSLAVEASGNAPAESIRFAEFLISDERYRNAEDILLSALRSNPTNAAVLTLLGSVYVETSEFPRAEQVVASLKSLGRAEALEAATGLQAEIIARREGRDKAIAFLEGLTEGEDQSQAVQLNLLRTRLENGEVEEAVAIAQDLAAGNPENPRLAFLLGNTHLAVQQFESAIQVFTDVASQYPEVEEAYIQLSRAYSGAGDDAAARRTIDEGLAVRPDGANLLWAKASFLEADNDIEGAIEIYERLYSQDSNAPIVANNLASLLSTYRDDEESLARAYTVGRRLRGTEIAPFQDTYGWILHRRGDYEEALTYLEPAARSLSGDALVQYHLGMTYLKLQRHDDARVVLQRAVDLAGPDDERPQIAIARKEIERMANAELVE